MRKILFFLFPLTWLPYCGFSQTILTLEKALEYAEKNSPSVVQSKLNLEGNKAALEAQQASLKSNFALNVSPFNYSRTRAYDNTIAQWNTNTQLSSYGGLSVKQPIKQTDGTLSLNNTFGWAKNSNAFLNSTNTTFFNELNLAFEQPLFTYNRTKMNLEILKLNLENAQIRFDLQKLAIEQAVTQHFYSVHSSMKAQIIVTEELKNNQLSFGIIKNKVDAGLAAKEELVQAEIDMTSSQARLYNQQVGLENAKDRLKEAIGLPLEEEVEVLAEIGIDPVEVDMQKAIDFAMVNRMELRQREIDIKNAYMELTRQQAVNEFSGNMSLSVGLSGDNADVLHVYDQPETTPQVGFQFQIPIYDWGQRKALIRQAETNIQSSELSLKEERTTIKMNIRQIYRNLHNLQLQIKIKEKNIENAQLTYEINLERYRNGNLTSMDLNQFQSQLSQTKIDLTNAIIDYKMELLNLKIQSLWDFENNTAVIEKNTPNEQ
jgi:outer membrane protein